MTDIHFGLKSNSSTHNRDCEQFVDWFIHEAKQNKCETGIFLGDWSNNRNSLNLVTLDTSIRCLEKLGAAFEQFFWFPGNHDLFYRDKRDVHSSLFGKHIPGITVVNDIRTIGDVTLVPWLVGDEWKDIGQIRSKYMFGHFELPSFYMNAMVQMPDHGGLHPSAFTHQQYVFSGHFHKRQNQGKIWYIGNAFPHNYSDTWDDERGMMTLEWGGKPQFKAWDDAPKYRTIKLSELIDQQKSIMKSKMYFKVALDIQISYEEATFLKETFMTDYDIREFSITPYTTDSAAVSDDADTDFVGVDQMVSGEILNINSDTFNNSTLLEIYNSL